MPVHYILWLNLASGLQKRNHWAFESPLKCHGKACVNKGLQKPENSFFSRYAIEDKPAEGVPVLLPPRLDDMLIGRRA